MAIILITGSREGFDENDICKSLENYIDPQKDEIIHGGAPGVDTFAENWCKSNSCKSRVFRPVKGHIRSYYLHRNAEMVALCETVIAFWDGVSRGTKFTIDYADAREKEVIKIIKK
jgi:hypothetical protein